MTQQTTSQVAALHSDVGPWSTSSASPISRVTSSRRAPERLVRLDGLRIVVIEDDPDALDLLGYLLTDRGAEVHEASCAAEGFQVIQRVVPDLVVSDIGLPGEDGYSLLRRVRELPESEGGTVPAIALTAFARSEDRAKALQAGFHEHHAKPLDLNRLLDSITALIHAKG